MTVSIDSLRKALREALGTGEWVINETRRSVVSRELGGIDAISERTDHQMLVTVYRDGRQNRGQAVFALGPGDDQRVSSAIAIALDRAGKNRGPLWSLPRPSAPARVALVDPSLSADPAAAIADLAGILGAADRRTRIRRARIDVATDEVRVVTSNELDIEYRATALEIDCVVVSGSQRLRLSAPVKIRARRLADLDLAGRLDRVVERLSAEAAADPLSPGVYDLIVDSAALERRTAGGFGLFAPLVAQASGQLARQALSRYQPGQSVYGETELTGDPLTLVSDGSMAFGWRSAPFAERGEPVRRFALIDGGVSVNLALDAREAALRSQLPNGGVRNLVIAPGDRTRDGLATGRHPALIATAIGWLDANPLTGDVAAELTGATTADGKPVRGGQLAGNLFDWLPRMRLGADRHRSASFAGPRWIGFPAVEIR